jgi:hypothetical protein
MPHSLALNLSNGRTEILDLWEWPLNRNCRYGERLKPAQGPTAASVPQVAYTTLDVESWTVESF